jgi:hypothetical protein
MQVHNPNIGRCAFRRFQPLRHHSKSHSIFCSFCFVLFVGGVPKQYGSETGLGRAPPGTGSVRWLRAVSGTGNVERLKGGPLHHFAILGTYDL